MSRLHQWPQMTLAQSYNDRAGVLHPCYHNMTNTREHKWAHAGEDPWLLTSLLIGFSGRDSVLSVAHPPTAQDFNRTRLCIFLCPSPLLLPPLSLCLCPSACAYVTLSSSWGDNVLMYEEMWLLKGVVWWVEGLVAHFNRIGWAPWAKSRFSRYRETKRGGDTPSQVGLFMC